MERWHARSVGNRKWFDHLRLQVHCTVSLFSTCCLTLWVCEWPVDPVELSRNFHWCLKQGVTIIWIFKYFPIQIFFIIVLKHIYSDISLYYFSDSNIFGYSFVSSFYINIFKYLFVSKIYIRHTLIGNIWIQSILMISVTITAEQSNAL